MSRSGLVECAVTHERFSPKAHRFVYRLFYFAVDLDERPRTGLFSIDRWNVFSLREKDFLPLAEARFNGAPVRGDLSTLKARALAFCAEHGVIPGEGAKVVLVTLPRLFGYHFNPVSFYFISAADGTPGGAIAEVTNTFREMKPYFVPVVGDAFRVRVPKAFYVSPFSPLDVAFDFHLRLTEKALTAQIDDFAGSARTLHSVLAGRRLPLTTARLAWFLIKYPLVTVKIISLIHFQAFRLWLKKVPYFPKASNPGAQTNLYRPHKSIQGREQPINNAVEPWPGGAERKSI